MFKRKNSRSPEIRVVPIAVCVFLFLAVTSCTPQNHTSIEVKERKPSHGGSVSAQPIAVSVSSVVEGRLHREIKIPAELLAFRDVAIYPKAQGFISSIFVDRGSAVKKGQLLVQIQAPELEANYREAEGKYEAAQSALLEAQAKADSLVAQQQEAQAKLEGEAATHRRIKIASQTVGAIAVTDLETAEKRVVAARAHVQAIERMGAAARGEIRAQRGRVKAAEQVVRSTKQVMGYLTVRAPFSGVVTERNVHEGSLVNSSNASVPMLRVQEATTLRLLVPVPESAIAGVSDGTVMNFTVPAFVGKTFSGTVSRISHGLDRKTRTMLIEADVPNPSLQLEPGMYAEVVWRMERPYPTLFVPAAAVAAENDKSFVFAVRDGKARQIAVSRGQSMGDSVEVVGDLHRGDRVIITELEGLTDGAAVLVEEKEGVAVKTSDKHNE